MHKHTYLMSSVSAAPTQYGVCDAVFGTSNVAIAMPYLSSYWRNIWGRGGDPDFLAFHHPMMLMTSYCAAGEAVREYINGTVPLMAFGEYWDTCEYTDGVLNYNQDAHRQRTVNWCDKTGGTSAAFDFTTKGIDC